jgi:predicted Zn-dependent protease
MSVFLFFEVRSSPDAPPARATAVKGAEPEPATTTTDDGEGDAKVRPVAAKDRPYTPGLRHLARKAQNERGGAAGSAPALATEEVPAGDKLEGPKLDAVMAEANRAYDKMDFDEARSIAKKVLKQHPTNTRMLRIMTSAYCIENDNAEAQKYFNLLPAPDRAQMKTRCARYGVAFTDPPGPT